MILSPGGQLADHLAIRAQDGGGLGADDLDVNRGRQRQDQGAIGQRVRANRGEGKDIGRREYDGAAGGQRISGGAGGRADDQAVAAVARERVAINADIQFDEAGSNAAADDDVVESGLVDQPPAAAAGGLDQDAGLET